MNTYVKMLIAAVMFALVAIPGYAKANTQERVIGVCELTEKWCDDTEMTGEEWITMVNSDGWQLMKIEEVGSIKNVLVYRATISIPDVGVGLFVVFVVKEKVA